MKERPILFSAPMVRSILAGTKTQTRRVCKPRPQDNLDDPHGPIWSLPSPYGAPGDRLWVRETFGILTGNGIRTVYRADGAPMTSGGSEPVRHMKWHPSIFMRRQQSRILLEVVGVRVERLQSISMVDAIAEGAQRFADIPGTGARWSMEQPTHTDQCLGSPQMAFANLYNKIHAGENWNLKPGPSPWDANPWVWAVEFKRIAAAECAA